MPVIVAIDGPSASGKSTVSRKVAQKLNFIHVDSGALYRGVTWYFLSQHVNVPNDAAAAAALRQIRMEFLTRDNAIKFSIDGLEPDAALRSEEVSREVSRIAALPAAREWVARKLRQMPAFGNLVMEGRDIGTAVFPEARFKFYLDAAPEERARRRYLELKNAGAPVEYGEILSSIMKRDRFDSSRSLAPLRTAPDAIVIQSTKMSVDEAANAVLQHIPPGAASP
ncbi:MAG: (d)CMP kinase, partial [Kiritimatiellae bacterium]|nr:(d)CMP kinase [Kiritimatiellia bacterium]